MTPKGGKEKTNLKRKRGQKPILCDDNHMGFYGTLDMLFSKVNGTYDEKFIQFDIRCFLG